MLKKLLIIIWFGPYPEWLDQWVANMEHLKYQGYDYKIYSNLDLFEERVRETLGIEPNIKVGSGKPWDFRPALATLFAEDVKGYDYWGHTDFDCVYGDVEKFIPDKELKKYDIWANNTNYICGPWTLYRNCEEVNNAYKNCPVWKFKMESPEAFGWAEHEFTNYMDKNFKVNYSLSQPKDWNDMSHLRFNDGKLFDGDEEIMMAHFRRTKQWPVKIY